MSPDAKALRARFHAHLTEAQAIEELHAYAATASGPHKFAMAEAFLDIRQSRSMQSTMARFRRGIGVDPAKG